MADFSQAQKQSQKQQQIQRLSQNQIQAISFLAMDSLDLRDEILKAVSENPALKIVSDRFTGRGSGTRSGGMEQSTKFQQAMEATETYGESLQEHLLHQLNSMNLSDDERSLSEKLIYNLDSDGFYGSNLAPEFLLDKKRPAQNRKMLASCMDKIQRMDPIGTCCRTWEESLFIQAKIYGKASPLALFLLNGHLNFLSEPDAVVVRKLEKYRTDWHKKAFAPSLEIDGIALSKDLVLEALQYIRKLNPRPAAGYDSDSFAGFNQPDVVVSIEKVEGAVFQNDFPRGVVTGNGQCHFQVKYASGVLPEIKIDQSFFDKQSVVKAQNFVNSLQFRETTIIEQACAIVEKQKNFFLDGKAPLEPLTRRQLAKELSVHESTISRTSNKKNSKFFQTPWGVYPASYFFCSSVSSSAGNEKISSSEIKQQIKVLAEQALSDQQITEKLNEQGIKISRRTVNKYRLQLGVANSYSRKKN